MLREECKEGVRVYWSGCENNPSDTGVIVKHGNSIFNDYFEDTIWVKWDSDGDVLHVPYNELEFLNDTVTEQLTEQKAVMFLLSKGYTVSKGETK